MKSIIKDIAVFLLIAIFIISGFSKSLIHMVAANSFQFIKHNYSMFEFINHVDDSSVKELRYYEKLNDLNSIRLYLQNVYELKKDDDTVVKLTNGYLTLATKYYDDKVIKKCANEIKKLQNICYENGTGFLYVVAPEKNYFGKYPGGMENYDVSNVDRFVSAINSENINNINLIEEMKNDGVSWEKSFFITDHHWTPKMGLWANEKICERLSHQYNFSIQNDMLKMANYDIQTYKDWFLGSQGKKAGRYFTNLGIDDIDKITPKFDTNFTVSQPLKNEIRSGSFSESIFYDSDFENKNIYKSNPYAAYSGGDFRQQIIVNNLINNNKKIVLIKDSYACVVAPFLSMQAKEVHIIDVRNFEYFYGEKINVENYIQQENPDVVIVLYNGCPTTDSRTDFF